MKKLSKESAKMKKSFMQEYAINDDYGLILLQTAMEARDVMILAQKQVDIDGLTVAGDRGQLRAHPLLTTIRDARSQFMMALKHLNIDILPLRDKPGRPPGR